MEPIDNRKTENLLLERATQTVEGDVPCFVTDAGVPELILDNELFGSFCGGIAASGVRMKSQTMISGLLCPRNLVSKLHPPRERFRCRVAVLLKEEEGVAGVPNTWEALTVRVLVGWITTEAYDRGQKNVDFSARAVVNVTDLEHSDSTINFWCSSGWIVCKGNLCMFSRRRAGPDDANRVLLPLVAQHPQACGPHPLPQYRSLFDPPRPAHQPSTLAQVYGLMEGAEKGETSESLSPLQIDPKWYVRCATLLASLTIE